MAAKRKIKSKRKKARSKGPKTTKSRFTFWSKKESWKFIIPIVLLTFAAFSPSLENGFVNWDDDRNFLENQNVVDVNKHNIGGQLVKIFKSGVIGNYNPLPIATFAFERLFFGFENPMPWHLTNILFHIICTLLVFRLMDLLRVNRTVALGVALLFAVHPLRVESVAWVTERKDVMFGAFYLGALINYIKYHRSQKKRKYLVFVYVLFILSLLSKIQAVTLPLSMLAIDYWRNRTINWKLVIEKIPYFLLALATGIIGILVLQDQGSLESNATYSFLQRLFVGSYSYMIYLVKSLVPYRMSPLYPYPETMPWYIYSSMAFVPAYIAAFVYAWKKKMKPVVFGLVFFTFNIFFLLQILGAGQGYLADRFTYIAYIGLFFIIAWYFDHFTKKIPRYSNGFYGFGAATILLFAFLTFNQNKIWKNSETLWTHVLKYNKNITVPWGNRANYYRDSGQTQKALSDYSEVIKLAPEKAAPYNSRAKLYFNSKAHSDLQFALRDYKKAVSLDPGNGEYLTNLGATYARLNDRNNALKNFTEAIRIKPDHAVAYLNRSIILQQIGKRPEALQDITTYLQFRPYESDMWYESARLKRLMGNANGAIADLNKAIQINTNKGLYYYERSKAFHSAGQINNARTDLQNAQRLGQSVDPNYANQLR